MPDRVYTPRDIVDLLGEGLRPDQIGDFGLPASSVYDTGEEAMANRPKGPFPTWLGVALQDLESPAVGLGPKKVTYVWVWVVDKLHTPTLGEAMEGEDLTQQQWDEAQAAYTAAQKAVARAQAEGDRAALEAAQRDFTAAENALDRALRREETGARAAAAQRDRQFQFLGGLLGQMRDMTGAQRAFMSDYLKTIGIDLSQLTAGMPVGIPPVLMGLAGGRPIEQGQGAPFISGAGGRLRPSGQLSNEELALMGLMGQQAFGTGDIMANLAQTGAQPANVGTVTVKRPDGTTYTINSPSVKGAAQSAGLTPQQFLQIYGQGKVSPESAAALGLGKVANTAVATGVYTGALPEQTRLRDLYQSQVGVSAPVGGFFTQFGGGRVGWQTDPTHPGYTGPLVNWPFPE